MYFIDHTTYRNTHAVNNRVRFLVFHYTELNFKDSVAVLTGDTVSAHYLVPDPEDPSYLAAGFRSLNIFNLVDEQARAWHAGLSAWKARHHLNDSSIGIEIVYQPQRRSDGVLIFPDYNAQQIEAVKELTLDILRRYPDIAPQNIVGHADITTRKMDPGPRFPWYAFYQCGIGAWYDPATKNKYLAHFQQHGLPVADTVMHALQQYGYATLSINQPRDSQKDEAWIRAFQMHFRPNQIDGCADEETCAILYALNEKYSSAFVT